MYLRLGVYQDLCRAHEHAKSSLRMLRKARNQSSFLQWWGSIVSLPEVVHRPPPADSCRTPAQRALRWNGLWQLFSHVWPNLVGSVWALLGSHCKVDGAGASSWQGQGLHGPRGTWFLQPTRYPYSQSRQKYLIFTQAEDLNTSCFAGKLYVFL